MKFREASISIVKAGRGYKATKNKAFLEDFIASGISCAVVDTSEYRTANTAYNSLLESIKRSNLGGTIGICVRNGELYVFQKGALTR